MNTSFEPKRQAPTQRATNHESQSAKAFPSRTIVHAKLEMTKPGDHDEREADAVANTIVSGGTIARKILSGGSGSSGAVMPRRGYLCERPCKHLDEVRSLVQGQE